MKNVRSAVNEAKYDDSTILSDSELGDIKIHDGVIAALSRRAALSVQGVSRLAGSQFVDNLAEIVGSRRMQARAINVDVDEDSRISIEIKLNLIFGCQIPQVAARVQQEIIKEVETSTGMTVKCVDVLVQDMEENAPAPDMNGGY